MALTDIPSPIFVAGHRGMVGSAVTRQLESIGCRTLTIDRSELDLRDELATFAFLQSQRPAAVVMAAARAGGIVANQSAPVEFLTDNLRMIVNVIQGSHQAGVRRLLFLGSTCIYPRDCRQPMREEELLGGPLESTNEAYALAKINGVKLCQYLRQQSGVLYRSVMPTNLYGPGDNYHPEHSHVVAGLLQRMHQANETKADEVSIWGTGKPRRDLLHVDDLAEAITLLLTLPDPPDWVNVGTGKDWSVMEVANQIADLVGFRGRIVPDLSRPDGAPVKRTDVTRIHQLGWRHQIELDRGLAMTYQSFLAESRRGALRSG